MDPVDGRGSLIELGEFWRINGSDHFDWKIDSLDQLEKCKKNSKC
jgi:hypothetical protein